MHRWKASVIAAAMMVTWHGSAAAQFTDWRAGLQSNVDSVRISALTDLVNRANAGLRRGNFKVDHARVADFVKGHDSLDVVLITLLEVENARISKRGSSRITEEFSEYYASLIAVVAGLHDPRSVHALVGAMNTGRMARDGVVELGHAAVGPALAAAQSVTGTGRYNSLAVLDELVRADAVRDDERPLVRAVFLDALNDPSEINRIEGIRGLESFLDPEVRARIKNVSINDPIRTMIGNRVVYPVRNAAAELLRRHMVAK